jgi:hypothetical protein
LIRLQEQLDRERELLERAQRLEHPTTAAAAEQLCAPDVCALIPGCDSSPNSINSNHR